MDINFEFRNHKYGDCLISDEYKFIYINIPKCASGTVKKTLSKYTKLKYTNFLNLDSEKIKNYLNFCLIREPVSRFKSAFYTLHYKNIILPNYTLKNLVEAIEKYGFWNEHILPQYRFISDLHIDYIGLTNKLEIELNKIKKIVGLPKIKLSNKHIFNGIRISNNEIKQFLPFIYKYYKEDFILWERYSTKKN